MENTKQTRIKQLFSQLESEIKPGTRGAPKRRKHAAKIEAAHYRHMLNMDSSSWGQRTERRGARFDAEKKYNVPLGVLRHGPSDPAKEAASRLMKMHSRLVARIQNAPAEYLIRIVDTLNINIDRIDSGLGRYLSMYPAAKIVHNVYYGKVYFTSEDTEWEKYGGKSYPRTVNRRICTIDRNGKTETVYQMKHGEKYEVALNRLVKNRKKKLDAVKFAYKIVERNGKLRSVYNQNYVYQLNRWVTETPKHDHNGGIYCYGTEGAAVAAAITGEVFNQAWAHGKTLFLCKCEMKGKIIAYGEKLSVEKLRITEVIREIAHG